MSLNDSLANCLSVILRAEKIAKKECEIFPISKVIKAVLKIMQDQGYIGDQEIIEDSKGARIKVNLLSKINNCNAIKPKFIIKHDEVEKFEARFLPAKGFGILLITTSKGIMTNDEVKKNKIGGRLLAFIY